MHAVFKEERAKLELSAEDVPSGNFYRKVGTWFEWN